MASQFLLLKDRRFAPLFITQFLGAFNDNLMKAFFVVLIAYGLWKTGEIKPEVIVSASAGLFILPFVLFCPLAGEITDKYDKAAVIRITKITEIGVVLCGIAAIWTQSLWLALCVLFALGAQSAFFSPGKFSLLPQQLKREELVGANGLISTGTFLAILMGTILGTVMALREGGALTVSFVLLACATIGYLSSRYILPAPARAPDRCLMYNPLKAVAGVLRYAYWRPQGVFVAMLGVSWFYFVASTIHAQFPNFAKQSLGVDTDVLSFFMIIFSIGVAIGGLLNNFILRSRITPVLVPWSAFAIAFFCLDLYFASAGFKERYLESGGALIGFLEFLALPVAWRLIADLFLLAVFGGLYVVPLRTIVQSRTPNDHIARVVAANSMLDSLFILSSSIVVTFLLSIGWSVRDVFMLLSLLTVCVGIFFRCYKAIRCA